MMKLSNQEIESMYPQAWRAWIKRPEYAQGVPWFFFKDGDLLVTTKIFMPLRQIGRSISLPDRKEMYLKYDDQENLWKPIST